MLALRTVLCSSRGSAISLRNALRHATAVKYPICKVEDIECSRVLTVNSIPSLHSNICNQHRWYSTKVDESDLKGENRIYYGSLSPRIKAVKVFSLTTSIAGIAAQPILIEQGMKMGGTGMAVFLCGIAGFFTFVTPFLLHFITKKYVTEIHYNPTTEEYTATTIALLLYKIQTKFRAGDVKVPEVPGMFTSFLVNDKPLFVDPLLFEDPEHYVRIMGYDKPLDFKLDLQESEPAAKIKNTEQQSQK